jgi:hypothetical protein
VSGDTNGNSDVFVHENDVVAPAVVSITRADPTTAASVDFGVTFSEDVIGLDTSDFVLATTGSIKGASVTGLSGAGATYTITVSTGIGGGTLRLDIPATAIVTDPAGNPLSGLPYTGDKDYAVLIGIYLPMVLRNAP